MTLDHFLQPPLSEIPGTLMNQHVQFLSWDSEFFNRPIGRVLDTHLNPVTVNVVLEEARSQGIRCLYFEADPNDWTTAVTAQEHGFLPVDVRVTLDHPLHLWPDLTHDDPIPGNLTVDQARDSDIERLQEIGVQIGLTSRFAFDKNFGEAESSRLYRIWVINSIHGYADVVLVARWSLSGAPAGLITCDKREGIAHIQLAGVHSDHRQRGIGTVLVRAALDWGKAQGAFEMHVVTQARNVPAQRLYQQMGFFTKSMTIYYHKWL